MIDSFEFNKIAMAVLGVIFAIFCVSLLSEVIFHAETPEEPAYVLAEVDTSGEGEAEEDSGPAFEPIVPIMASADPGAGENVFKKCASCHTVEEGGANKVGPNLYNIVGDAIAARDGFSYSAALVAYGEGKNWDYENLNGFLWKPKTYVDGTAMGFVGLSDVEDRADVVAYLRTLSADPVPLPEPEAEPAAAEETEAATEPASEEGTEPAAEETEPAEESAEPAAGADTGSEEPAAETEEAPAEEQTDNGETAPAEETTEEEPAAEQPVTEDPASEEAPSDAAEPADSSDQPAEPAEPQDSESSETPVEEDSTDGNSQAN